MQRHVLAVGAFELRGQAACKRQAAAPAKWRFDEADVFPAARADKPLGRSGALRTAKLADVRVNKSHERIGNFFERRHVRNWLRTFNNPHPGCRARAIERWMLDVECWMFSKQT